MHQVKKKGILEVRKNKQEIPFSMTTITELSHTLQELLGEKADELAKSTGFIQRQRQITGAGFAQALILGGLAQANASRKQIHQQALEAGMRLSVQGFDQRFTSKAGDFMQALLAASLNEVVQSTVQRVPLPQFKGVYITDCTRLPWQFRALKLGLRFELQQGEFKACLMDIKTNDQKAAVVDADLPKGALHLGDLGFFKLGRFRKWQQQGVYWLSRYKIGTILRRLDGQTLDLKSFLTGTEEVRMKVLVGGGKHPLEAQLVAAPLSQDALAQRQGRLKEQARLDQRPPSAAQSELIAWTIYLSNIPDLSFEQAFILARTRWQIELIFKLWKSHAAILRSRSADPLRQFCEGIGKLVGVLIAHWTLLVAAWQMDCVSSLDALQIFRKQVSFLQRALQLPMLFDEFFAVLQEQLALAPRRSSRQKVPLAFQLWERFELIFP
jgi:hypothetical protein